MHRQCLSKNVKYAAFGEQNKMLKFFRELINTTKCDIFYANMKCISIAQIINLSLYLCVKINEIWVIEFGFTATIEPNKYQIGHRNIFAS